MVNANRPWTCQGSARRWTPGAKDDGYLLAAQHIPSIVAGLHGRASDRGHNDGTRAHHQSGIAVAAGNGDAAGPGASFCAVFIDRQLAGPYGDAAGLYMKPPFMHGAGTQGYQMPQTPTARYRAGLKALADYIKTTYGGKSFQELPPSDQDMVLAGLEGGSIALKDVNGKEFFDLLLQNTQEGFFADPIYGGNRDMVG